MRGAIPPLPQYACMTWCSGKTQEQLYLYFYLSNIILSFSLRLPSGLFPSVFPTKILYAFLISLMRPTCPVHLILRHSAP
jgi:hypothetical protein